MVPPKKPLKSKSPQVCLADNRKSLFTLNPVPFVYVTENKNAKVENGVLADVAPSILHIMGMAQPADMTGKDLIIEN